MYDLVVIGGGPGGYAAALQASELGGKVALVEAAALGGTCVNRGCIPTMVWLQAAERLRALRTAEALGITARVEGVDAGAVVARKEAVVEQIRAGMAGILEGREIHVVSGRAEVEAPGRVRVGDRVLEGRALVIATGSRSEIPAVEGLDQAATPAEAVPDLAEIPSSVLVWGGGPMDVEMAGLFRSLGAEVHLAAGPDGLLPREDDDTAARVAKALFDLGVRVHLNRALEAVRRSGDGWEAHLSGPGAEPVRVERVVTSARRAHSEGLGLEEVGVARAPDGSVRVNARLETSVPGIYAAGDVTGGWMLSHAATAMGRVAARNALGGSATFASHLVPRGIWGVPEVGSVGLTEEQAEEEGFEVAVGEFPYAANGLAAAQGEGEGAVKIVSERRCGEILGVHIVGKGATELLGEALLAIQLEATAGEWARGMRLHPTFSESLVEAARSALEG
ncbi:MAG: dihydrolipoyl dehydrogenase [Deferrisomatales bacterium]